MYGSTVAAPVWSKIMKQITKGMPVKKFREPSEAIRNGKYVGLPNVIGRGVESATERLEEAGFTAYVAGEVSSGLDAGTVAFTDPAGSALPGSKIGLYLSNGQAPFQVAPAAEQPAEQPAQPAPKPVAPKPKKTPPPKR